MVAAPAKGDGGGDAIDSGSGLELGDHQSLSVYSQFLARADHIQIEVGDGAGERIGGILHVMSGAQQPQLLAIPGGKENAAGGAVALRLPQPGDFQHRGDAGRVVVGSVHNGPVRLAPQVVVVGADDDNLVAVFGVRAGQQAQDVAGLDLFPFLGDHGHAHGGGERRGGKAQAQVVQRVIGADEQILRDGLRDQVGGDGLGHPGGLAVGGSPVR